MESYVKSEIELTESLEDLNFKINQLIDKQRSLKNKIDDLKRDKTRLYKEKFILESKLSHSCDSNSSLVRQ